MKRSLSLFLAAIIVLLSICVGGCGDDDIDWVTGETYATGGTGSSATVHNGDAAVSQPQNGGFEGSSDAPVFRDGSYKMVNSTTTLTEYLTDAGAVYYSDSTVSRYTYILDITTGGSGLKCSITFDGIYIAQTVDGETFILLDTSTRSYLSESTEPYYDIIGLSYSVTIGENGKITAIDGVDELAADYPDSAFLLDKENLLGVAASYFYPMPDTFAYGTAWALEQYGLVNTYMVSSFAHDRYGITILGSEQAPFSYTTADGLTVDYRNVSALSGTLYMNSANRALQEITSMQKSSGIITGEGVEVPFNYNVTSLTTVTEEK